MKSSCMKTQKKLPSASASASDPAKNMRRAEAHELEPMPPGIEGRNGFPEYRSKSIN